MSAKQSPDDDLRELLEYLLEARGVDFASYKSSTLRRRLGLRLEATGAQGWSEYRNQLEANPEEFVRLFDTLLINVTGFFRDPEAWQYLAGEIIPEILARKGSDDPIRVWSAGCSSGEEAYTLAILLAEAIGVEALRRRVKMYATDIDDDALEKARRAVYRAEETEAVPPELRERYFRPEDTRFVFRGDLRGVSIFGHHDLLRDPPISKLDLLVCRNTLMYFNAEAQDRTVAALRFALNEGGFLLLGKSEMLLRQAEVLPPKNLRFRVFQKRQPREDLGERLRPADGRRRAPPETDRIALREAAWEGSSVPEIVVDAAGDLALANARAREQFGIQERDIGRPLRDLELSYRPADLRSAIDRARSSRTPVLLDEVEQPLPGGETQRLRIRVAPILDDTRTVLGTDVVFLDVTSERRFHHEIDRLRQERETAHEELQASNEELETTNEELQSTVEELETTNEELQSTNEELETMNEELQSTNTELQTINQELSIRTDDLNQLNALLEGILLTLDAAVAALDAEQRVILWNHHAEELWGARTDEVAGHPFRELDIGLPVAQLEAALTAIMRDRRDTFETTLEAVNRRGRSIRCRVLCRPLRMPGERTGVIVWMERTEDSEERGR